MSGAPIRSPRPDWRAAVVVVGVLAGWTVLAARLVQLQWLERDDFAHRVARQRSLLETIPARPGDIVDCNGRVLATTITRLSLFVVPSRVDDPAAVAARLGEVLSIDVASLRDRIAADAGRHFLWVARRLDDGQAERIRDLDLPPRTWGFREEYLRRYPQGLLACHVLGLRDVDNRGRGGIEESRDRVLRGREGRRRLIRDARGRVIDVRDDVAERPEHGRTVVLSIDTVVQLHTERILADLAAEWAPASACAIVVDVPTCEVLALASWPTFDPNRPADVPPAAWTNTAVASMFEPGSTFKPFVVARALEAGVLDRDELLHCGHGRYRMGPRILHDHHPYGELSVADVLVKSSNVGMARIGERLGNDALFDAVAAWGFGRRTGIELPGEIAGRLRPRAEWDVYSTGSIPMGQEIGVTPIQLAAAHAALAHGGVLRNPRLVLRVVDNGASGELAGGEEGSVVTSDVVSSDVARWLVEGPMTGVVDRGTGTRAKLEGYAVFGKTGTAQKIDRETSRYSSTRHVCAFVCGAPADAPRVVVLVSVDEPTTQGAHFGGTVAAPAAREILRETLVHLRVPPR